MRFDGFPKDIVCFIVKGGVGKFEIKFVLALGTFL